MRGIVRFIIPAGALVLLALPIERPMQAQSPAPGQTQSPGVRRIILQRADTSVPGREMVMLRVELDPGADAGRHTHFGEEMVYVLEGEGELSVEGQPARAVRAGDVWRVPAGIKHDVRNTGAVPFKVVAVLVVEKGRPLVTPAP
jgi:quercetin dioxygenase-like cupin family protein